MGEWVTSTYNTIYITMHMIIQICLVTDIIPIQTEREREKECDKIKNKIGREREKDSGRELYSNKTNCQLDSAPGIKTEI